MEKQTNPSENSVKVQKRLEKYQREVEEGERQLRDQILKEAGFYEQQNDVYFGQISKVYEVSNEQYAQILALRTRKMAMEREAEPAPKPVAPAVQSEPDEPPFQIEMNSGSDNSGYAFFFKIIACVLWIGGAVLAVTTSFVENMYGDPSFKFSLFLPTALTYLLYGGAAMCAAEMLENIAAIRTALQSIHFKRK